MVTLLTLYDSHLPIYVFVSKTSSKLCVIHIHNNLLKLPRNITFTRHFQSFLFYPLFLFVFFIINDIFSCQMHHFKGTTHVKQLVITNPLIHKPPLVYLRNNRDFYSVKDSRFCCVIGANKVSYSFKYGLKFYYKFSMFLSRSTGHFLPLLWTWTYCMKWVRSHVRK